MKSTIGSEYEINYKYQTVNVGITDDSGKSVYFSAVSDADWITIVMNDDGTFSFIVTENCNTTDRVGVISCENLEQTDDYIVIVVTQKADTYLLTINKTTDTFEYYPEKNSKTVEKKTYTVTVKGGADPDFIVKGVREYKKVNGYTFELVSDYGIKVEKKSKTQFDVICYGLIGMDSEAENYHYVIILAHKYNRMITAELDVSFSTHISSIYDCVKLETGTTETQSAQNIVKQPEPVFAPLLSTISPVLRNEIMEEVPLPLIAFVDGDEDIGVDKMPGEITLQIETNPSDSMIMVELSDIFVRYSVRGHNIILTYTRNTFADERPCEIRVRNAEQPGTYIVRRLIQKGNE